MNERTAARAVWRDMVMPGDPGRHTVIALVLDTATDEWWAWREPVIGWLLSVDEGDPSLVPLVWRADYMAATRLEQEESSNSTYLYGLYRADEAPDAGELSEAAQSVRRKLAWEATRRRERAESAGAGG